jgi:hypothetical protein
MPRAVRCRMIAGRAHMHVPRLMTGIIGKKKDRKLVKSAQS